MNKLKDQSELMHGIVAATVTAMDMMTKAANDALSVYRKVMAAWRRDNAGQWRYQRRMARIEKHRRVRVRKCHWDRRADRYRVR